MQFAKWVPPSATVLALALGLFTVGSPSSAWAQEEESDQRTEPRVEKRVIRVMEGDEDDERGGDVGYLGVQVQRLTSALRRAKNIPGSVEGSLVNRVEEDGPAEKAGVQKGDVVLEVDQKPTPGPDELIDVVRDLKPGAKAKVVVLRTGTRKTFYVTVGSRPDDRFEFPMPPMPPDEIGRVPDAPRGQREYMRRWEYMRRHHDDIERQLEDIREELAQLRREIRELRSELGLRREGRGRD